MTNYSRTTLRELKKRYLNVLKKCLLANLGLILLSTPSMADSVAKKNDGSSNIVIDDTQNDGSELLEYLTDETYYVITDGVFSNIIIDETGKVVTYIGEPNIDENGFITYTYKPNGGILNNSGQLTFKGGIVSFERGVSDISGYGVNSGGGSINNSGTITFENSEFINNKVVITGSNSHAFGGAVLNNGEMNFGDVRFYNNQLDGMAESMGGAVYNGSSGEMTFSGNVLFENNQANPSNAQLGGAIANKGTMVFGSNSDVTFFNNSSTYGGAIYNQGNISFDGKVLFEKNNASSYGVIWNRGSSSILSFKTANFIGNQVGQNSSTSGGGISNGGLFSITESALFQGNKVSGQYYGTSGGGAIYNTSNGVKDEQGNILTYGAYLKNATFLSNIAEHNGVKLQSTMQAAGGAVSNTGTIKFDGYTVFGGYKIDENGEYVLDSEGNKISLGNVVHAFSFNDAGTERGGDSRGGAIFNEGTMTLGQVAFIANRSKADLGPSTGLGAGGGAIYNQYGSITFADTALFEDNVSWSGYSAEGGAIKNRPNSGIASINFKGKAEFYNNQSLNVNGSYNTGGAIANYSEMAFEKEAIFGKYALDENGNKTYDSDGNPITLGNKAISEQSGSTAGAVYNIAKGVFDFKGITTFIGNISNGYTSAAGGAVTHYGNLIKFHDDAEFLDNKAIGQTRLAEGGAIFTDYSSSMIFNKKADFKNNSALGYTAASGGAIFNKTGSATIKQNVDEEGNAILDENGNPSLEPVYTYGMTFNGDTTFTGNKAESETGNSYGGAIRNNSYMLLAGKNTFGGYEVDENGEYVLDLEGKKISLGNEANQGGAIYNTGGKKEGDVIAYGMTLGKSTFMGNTALSLGGAIFNSGYMNFTDEAVFEGNKASSQGGAIHNQNGTINFGEGVLFVGNISENAGGAISNTSKGIQNSDGEIVTYGIELKNAKFFSNEVIKVTSSGYAWGGAISNNDNADSTMRFMGHTVFGGYAEDGASLGNIVRAKEYTKDDGTVGSREAQGGAIYNSYATKMVFDSVDFIGNKAISEKNTAWGGAFFGGQNRNDIRYAAHLFNGPVLFKENEAVGTWAQGGAINNGAKGQKDENDKILKYGVTFKDTATFYSNKTRNVTTNGVGAGRGGAIDNTGTMIFEDKAIFGGYLTDETTGEYVLDENGNKISLGNMASFGGAISNYTGGYIVFSDVDFVNNIAVGGNIGAGASIHTRGAETIFNGLARFYDNIGYGDGGGGAIYAWSANITFNNKAEFVGNKSINDNAGGFGGAITHLYDSNITFNDHVLFKNNEANGLKTSMGGALSWGLNGNTAIIKFSSAEFIGNKVSSIQGDTRGGAIHNVGGSVVFEDTNSNVETPVVPNITYGMTFKGDTLFTSNKAESETGSSLGGAIFNQGYMLLAGENTFGGYLQDTEDADGDGDKTEYVLDSEGNKISLGNEAKYGGAIHNAGGKKEGDVIAYSMTLGKSTFMGNTALSQGGAIANSGYMNFTDEAVFDGNKVESENSEVRGGGIYNKGIVELNSAEFINNIADAYQESCGGSLYNNGTVTFNGIVKFEKNQSITKRHYASGGAIRNSSVNAIIDFNEHVLFGGYDSEGNSLGNEATVIGEEDEDGKIVGFHARGGAIYNEQQINFKSAEFINNKALGLLTTSLGGAIHNTGNAANINFSELAIFQDNIAEGYTNIQGGAIYNSSGLVTFTQVTDKDNNLIYEPVYTYGMTFNGDTLFTGNKAESVNGSAQGGAIYNSNNRYMLLAGENTFDSNQAKTGGAIYNSGGKKDGDVIAYGMTLGNSTFMNNTALSNGGAIYNTGYMNFSSEIGDIIFKDNKVNSLNSFGYSGAIQNDANSQITFNSDVIFDGNSVSAYIQVGGGAIVNNGTLNFKGGKFISNKAESSTFIVSGGAIANGGEITFSGHAIFGGRDENGNSLGNIAYAKKYINENGQEASSWAAGGAINNGQSGKIIFDSASFIANQAIADISGSSGGAIQNIGQIVFKGSSFFISNIAGGKLEDGQVGSGGVISMYNSNSSITFSSEGKKDDWTVFLNNKAIGNGAQYGGGIDISAGTLNFNSNFIFANNSGHYGKDLSYGASAKVNLNNGNETVGIFASGIFSSVGAQLNKTGSGVLIIGDMSENTSNRGLYTQTDGITIAKTDKFFGNKEAVNVINGGVLSVHGGIPTFTATLGNVTDEDGTKISSGTLEFQSNIDTVTNVSLVTDKFNVAEGATGTKIILGAYRDVEKKEHEDLINNKTVKMTNDDGTITEQSLKTLTYKDENGETKTYDVVANLFNTTTLGTEKAKYHLDSDVATEGNIIAFENSEVTFGLTEYKNGAYIMGENVTLNMQDGDTGDSVGFANLSGESSDLLFDIELKATTGEGLELASDKLSVQTPTDETYKVKVDLAKINVIGEVGDNGLNETYTTKVLEGEAEFETAINELKVFTDVYKYDVTVDEDKQSIKLSGIGASGENALKEAMDYEGDSAFKFSIVGKDYAFNLDTPITLGSGEKNIVGQGVDTSTIASGDKKMFVIDNENTSFKISDVKIVGTGEVIENKVGNVTLEKVAIEGGKVINKDELMIEESSVHVVENSGKLTATSSELGTVTNAGTLMLDTAEVSELENTGTLTANGSTIGALVNEKDAEVTGGKVAKVTNKGTLMLDTAEVSELENTGTLTANGSTIGALVNEKDAEVTGGKVAKVTNKGELTVTGATTTELMNEQEATITGGELETATNKEKGMLSLSAGLRAGTVTNEGELTLDGVTVADLTNSATLKANGSTIQKLVNEQEAELIASTVEDLTNTGKMTAKDLTLEGALKGTGTATLSGKLVADDIFKSENKIISDGMEVSDNVKKMELADLEIKDGTTLDIGTREVTAKDVKVGDKATLQVTLNNLDEFGTMKADKIEAGAGAGVHLVLGEKFEGGVFDVFKGTKGAGDLEVKHNNLYNVIEVEEGKYSFMTKDTEALQESLGATKEEVSVADAMTQGTASHETFARMQSEVLVALQSLDTQTVEKAKKALKAVGISEQPSSQSIAASHFNELTRVISQMAMEKEAEFGQSGGDMGPRAKVYIKGLYDRTKSSMGEGFRVRSKGAVLGVQSEVTDTLTLGVGYAFSQTTAKEDLRRTEVDTNTGFISAHYQPNAWWVSGLATFSRGEYEEEKQILSSVGKATYDVDSWGAQVMTGYDIKLKNAIITPEVGLRYLSVKQEGYTDTLGTTVSRTQSDYLTALVGVKGTWNMGAVRPTAGVTVGYDVISDDVSALNTLANGASYTVNGEALDRLSTTVTTGIEADLGERTTLKLEYSGTFRKEYQDHSGMLKLEMKF